MASATSSKRALVTGIRGFTGEFVSEELQAKGYEVYGTSQAIEAKNRNIRTIDLRNPFEIEDFVSEVQPHYVVHLAAMSFVGHGDTREIYDMNVVGTRNLLAALARQSSRPLAVVLASSANVYGNANLKAISETAIPNPVNDYAVSKLAMEYMAKLWFDNTGVGQSLKFLVPKIVHHFKENQQEISLGNLRVSRDFSDVRIIAKVYAELLSNPAPNETFNLASGHSTSIAELLDMLRELSGKDINVKSTVEFSRSDEIFELRGDASKLNAHIGDIGTIDLKETLKWMLQPLA
jgi:GDP-6-deoxy-D-talose 4-dehydrogenase